MAIIGRWLALLLCVSLVSGSQPTAYSAELSEYHFDGLELTVSLPAQAFVTGSRVSVDYEPLTDFDMTAAQLEVKMKQGGIMCEAVWRPEDADMLEITISMSEDEDSMALFSLMNQEEYYAVRLASSYAGYSELNSGIRSVYTDAQVYQTGQARYIRAFGTLRSEQVRENHLQYMTIVNGKRYEITLIEHLAAGEQEQDKERVPEHYASMMDEIVNGLRFDRIENEFLAKNARFVITATAITAACTVLLVMYIVSKRRAERAKNRQSVANGS